MRIRKIGTSVPLPSGQVIDSLNGSSTTNAPSIRAVNEGLQDIYSTSEVKTNKIWIDGKPIYRKTFTTTNLPGNATTTIGSISNLDTVIDINGIIPLELGASTKQYITLNHIRKTNLEWAFAPMVTGNDIQIIRGSYGTVSGTVYVTVEYTKTTD